MDDILKQHSLAYIGYPERATIKDKLLRTAFGLVILPIRLASSFYNKIKYNILKFTERLRKKGSDEDLQVDSPEEEIVQ